VTGVLVDKLLAEQVLPVASGVKQADDVDAVCRDQIENEVVSESRYGPESDLIGPGRSLDNLSESGICNDLIAQLSHSGTKAFTHAWIDLADVLGTLDKISTSLRTKLDFEPHVEPDSE
jgi:hypothetical protein